MDMNETITRVVEGIAVAIPQLVLMLSIIYTSLSKIKKGVHDFPAQTKTMSEDIYKGLSKTKKDIELLYKTTEETVKHIVQDSATELTKAVNGTLVGMRTELDGYKKELSFAGDQVNTLVLQNKLLLEVVVDLVSKDPALIKDGINQRIVKNYRNLKANLIADPKEIVRDEVKLKRIVEDAKELMGPEEFQKMVGGAHNDRRQAEKVFVKKPSL